jgi:hypothetical protein
MLVLKILFVMRGIVLKVLVKFGEYTGNGNADGPFIYTGFRPRLLAIKGVDATRIVGWYLILLEVHLIQ